MEGVSSQLAKYSVSLRGFCSKMIAVISLQEIGENCVTQRADFSEVDCRRNGDFFNDCSTSTRSYPSALVNRGNIGQLSQRTLQNHRHKNITSGERMEIIVAISIVQRVPALVSASFYLLRIFACHPSRGSPFCHSPGGTSDDSRNGHIMLPA